MREIKFRAWDGEIMQPLFAINSLSGKVIFNGEVKDWPLMQFTGLKDKNGVDIYEDDVIYLAGYGNYTAEFPFIDLYEGAAENDIGAIVGNIHQNRE